MSLVADIVSRARNGDQVAAALLSETSRRAQNGDPKARKMRKKFVAFIESNPPEIRYSGFGRESFDLTKVLRKGRELADKYLLLSHRGRPNANLARIASRFSGEDSTLFETAVLRKRPYALLTPAGFAGSAVSYAIRLQSVRNGGPISLLSAKADWELN